MAPVDKAIQFLLTSWADNCKELLVLLMDASMATVPRILHAPSASNGTISAYAPVLFKAQLIPFVVLSTLHNDI
jgi:hypothetical protein